MAVTGEETLSTWLEWVWGLGKWPHGVFQEGTGRRGQAPCEKT